MSIKTVSDRDLFWLVLIHVVFVISGVLLALSDRISGSHAPPSHAAPDAGKDAATVTASAAKKGHR